MRALTIKRPWCHCILHLGKRIENREWKRPGVPPVCRYRGELYLHAGMGWDPNAGRLLRESGAVERITAAILGDRNQPYQTGVIVARCRAIAHINPDGRVWLDADETMEAPALAASLDLRWWHGGYALVLADVQLIEPVPCKGRLGVWKVPADVAEQLRRVA